MTTLPNKGAISRSVSVSTVYSSPDPHTLWCYTPAIVKTPTGRLVATIDVGGPGVHQLAGAGDATRRTKRQGLGKIFTSDDGGRHWTKRSTFPFWHARPFCAAGILYIIGNAGDVMVIRSDDDAATWSTPHPITTGELWHGSATNVLEDQGRIYLCMERRTALDIAGWNVAGLTPVVFRANTGSDLLRREAWSQSEGPCFQDLCVGPFGDLFGIPFYPSKEKGPAILPHGRTASPPGWLEGNLVRITDPDHVWYDPAAATVHLLLRANTNGSGYAAILKMTEHADGRMIVSPVSAPSGKKMVFVPMPGGGLKFFLDFDAPSNRYWLTASIIDDSMCRIDASPAGRFNLPSNQRNKLGLYFSKNCVDWLFAGVVSCGETERHACNYPSFVVDRDDLLVIARSGDERARDGQYTNLVTLHRIRDFRSLTY